MLVVLRTLLKVLGGPHEAPEIEPGSATFKASALSSVLSLWSRQGLVSSVSTYPQQFLRSLAHSRHPRNVESMIMMTVSQMSLS